MRRVDCRQCGEVVVEEVPWGDGKHQLTRAYRLFLARWARKLSWQETAEAFHTSWDKVSGLSLCVDAVGVKSVGLTLAPGGMRS
jgi:transposase